MEDVRRGFPGWLFGILAAGGLLASGMYIGMMRLEGVTAGNSIRAAVFGIFGLLMLLGATGRRQR